MVRQGRGDVLVDVVLDVQVAAVARRAGQHGLVPKVHAELDLVGLRVEVALGVEIEVGDVVAQVGHLSLALGSADGVRRAHVGREETENVHEGNLVVDHLVLALGERHLIQVLVGPRVAGNLVTIGNHSLEAVRISFNKEA